MPLSGDSSSHRQARLRQTAIGVVAMGAVVLLAFFCVVVAHVVDRAAQRRGEQIGRIGTVQQPTLDRFSPLALGRAGGV